MEILLNTIMEFVNTVLHYVPWYFVLGAALAILAYVVKLGLKVVVGILVVICVVPLLLGWLLPLLGLG